MISGIDSAALKLLRVAEHINAIRDAIWDYVEREPSSVTKHPDGSYELNFIEAPPDIISVIAGEAIYQLRSALDHLAFDLVKLNPNGINLPAEWDEKCAFPLWLDIPKKTPTFNCFERTLPGITVQAFTFIESVQPYNRGDVGIELGILAILSNIDKHRHLNLTKPQAHRRDEATVLYKGSVMRVESITRVEDGAKIGPAFGSETEVLKMHVGGFTPFVSFNEPTLDPGTLAFSVESLLETCLDKVQRIVVPAFEKFIKQP